LNYKAKQLILRKNNVQGYGLTHTLKNALVQ
jgi:hypothetical protein